MVGKTGDLEICRPGGMMRGSPTKHRPETFNVFQKGKVLANAKDSLQDHQPRASQPCDQSFVPCQRLPVGQVTLLRPIG
jgi:hypothetical protein